MAETDLNFDQQRRIFPPTLAQPVTVIGAGSVGSQLAINLARLGCTQLTVWDGDSVASHNIPMSAYRLGDISRPKVRALAELVRDATGVQLSVVERMYAGEPLKGAVVSCVDTMDARADIWRAVRDNPFVPLLVDTRLGGENIMVFAIQPCAPEDIAYYEHFSYTTKDAVLMRCGFHGAIHVSGTAANAACAALTEWWMSGKTKRHLQMLCGHFEELKP